MGMSDNHLPAADPCERRLDLGRAQRRQAARVERLAGTATRLFSTSPPCRVRCLRREASRGQTRFPVYVTGFAGQGAPAREATGFRQVAKTVYRI